MIPAIALQLYTVRDLLREDFTGTMEKIATMGYTGVETAFFESISLKEAARVFRDLNLEVVAIHCDIPVADKEKEVFEQAALFECDRLVWHGWPQAEAYASVEGINSLVQLYNQANSNAKAIGCTFGIHNHWWEFEQVEGRYPYQLLHAEMDESIFWELDTYWVKVAGLDPARVVVELADRAAFLHLKDGPGINDVPKLAVGKGVMDFPAIMKAAKTPDWVIVELDDCATDMLEAVQDSFAYLTQQGLAKTH